MPTDGSKQTERDAQVPDIDSASADYARRFAGKTGAWFLDVQARAVLGLMPAGGGTSILDVGGGHNQLAEPLVRAGYRVTVHGSAAECRTRVEASPVTRTCPFVVSPPAALPFPDRAFDAVVSVRMLAHFKEWQALIAELCRVAADTVIVDFPNRGGVNAIAPALFGAKKKIEGNTRYWHAFAAQEIREAFVRQGFHVDGETRQLLLPMAFYRALNCQPLAAFGEGACRGMGMTRTWGSPIVVRATRQGGKSQP